MRTLCRSAKLHYCDLLGHPIDAIAKVSGQAAKMKPGARPPLNDAYFRRMSAIEFAVKYDDGVGSGLADADIVLVGVSRTSKTPLSIYLGYLGYKTANVPLVKGIEPPAELFTIDQSKVVGLTIDAQRLSEIRGERIRWMRGDRKYASLVEIYEELEYAEQMHRRLGCPVLEVSELSIEEISHRIIQLVERRRAEAAATATDEAQATGPEVALGHLVRRARRRARPLLRPLHAVLVRPADLGQSSRISPDEHPPRAWRGPDTALGAAPTRPRPSRRRSARCWCRFPRPATG